jgi:hypothetical protein
MLLDLDTQNGTRVYGPEQAWRNTESNVDATYQLEYVITKEVKEEKKVVDYRHITRTIDLKFP